MLTKLYLKYFKIIIKIIAVIILLIFILIKIVNKRIISKSKNYQLLLIMGYLLLLGKILIAKYLGMAIILGLIKNLKYCPKSCLKDIKEKIVWRFL